MDSIRVTKPDMAVLNRQRLPLSPFGMLAQTFSEKLMERTRAENGTYERVPLDFLEPAEQPELPGTVEQVLHFDVRLVLDALRREQKDRESQAEQRILERVIQLEKKLTRKSAPQTLSRVHQNFYETLHLHLSGSANFEDMLSAAKPGRLGLRAANLEQLLRTQRETGITYGKYMQSAFESEQRKFNSAIPQIADKESIRLGHRTAESKMPIRNPNGIESGTGSANAVQQEKHIFAPQMAADTPVLLKTGLSQQLRQNILIGPEPQLLQVQNQTAVSASASGKTDSKQTWQNKQVGTALASTEQSVPDRETTTGTLPTDGKAAVGRHHAVRKVPGRETAPIESRYMPTDPLTDTAEHRNRRHTNAQVSTTGNSVPGRYGKSSAAAAQNGKYAMRISGLQGRSLSLTERDIRIFASALSAEQPPLNYPEYSAIGANLQSVVSMPENSDLFTHSDYENPIYLPHKALHTSVRENNHREKEISNVKRTIAEKEPAAELKINMPQQIDTIRGNSHASHRDIRTLKHLSRSEIDAPVAQNPLLSTHFDTIENSPAPPTLDVAVPPEESGPALANRIRYGMQPSTGTKYDGDSLEAERDNTGILHTVPENNNSMLSSPHLFQTHTTDTGSMTSAASLIADMPSPQMRNNIFADRMSGFNTVYTLPTVEPDLTGNLHAQKHGEGKPTLPQPETMRFSLFGESRQNNAQAEIAGDEKLTHRNADAPGGSSLNTFPNSAHAAATAGNIRAPISKLISRSYSAAEHLQAAALQTENVAKQKTTEIPDPATAATSAGHSYMRQLSELDYGSVKAENPPELIFPTGHNNDSSLYDMQTGIADHEKFTYHNARIRKAAMTDTVLPNNRSEMLMQIPHLEPTHNLTAVRDIRGVKAQLRATVNSSAENMRVSSPQSENLPEELTYRQSPEASASSATHALAESDYVRQLPDWARRFLNSSNKAASPAAKPIIAAEVGEQTPSMQTQQTFRWSAPAYSEPVPTELREMAPPRQETVSAQPALSQIELERAADRVYRMIEDRVRRERRRLGL